MIIDVHIFSFAVQVYDLSYIPLELQATTFYTHH